MKVVLIGDSIRMGYLPLVAGKCHEAQVWGPTENCRHSVWALDHFEIWMADMNPDIMHFNFGIHDATIMVDGGHQILMAQYRLCLQRFIAKVKQLDRVQMIWATTTPLYSPEEGVPMAEWKVNNEAGIAEYNAAALEIIKLEGIPVNDLHDVIVSNDFSKCLLEDGCHMTDFGNEVLSDAVVKSIKAFI